MGRFESLDVWKRSVKLCAEIYLALQGSKDFGFRDQITRSGLSVPSNIAEGFERESHKQFSYFLKFAKGSAGELRTQIYIGIRIGHIEKLTGKKWLKEAEEISKMLSALIQSSSRKAKL